MNASSSCTSTHSHHLYSFGRCRSVGHDSCYRRDDFVVCPAASGPGLGTVAVPAIITVQPDNDNVPDRQQVATTTSSCRSSASTTMAIIDIEFHVAPSNGVTEYQVFESVDDNTGVSWNKYSMELGFGTGA